MGAVHQAKRIAATQGTQAAARYLRQRGYSLQAALYILTGK